MKKRIKMYGGKAPKAPKQPGYFKKRKQKQIVSKTQKITQLEKKIKTKKEKKGETYESKKKAAEIVKLESDIKLLLNKQATESTQTTSNKTNAPTLTKSTSKQTASVESQKNQSARHKGVLNIITRKEKTLEANKGKRAAVMTTREKKRTEEMDKLNNNTMKLLRQKNIENKKPKPQGQPKKKSGIKNFFSKITSLGKMSKNKTINEKIQNIDNKKAILKKKHNAENSIEQKRQEEFKKQAENYTQQKAIISKLGNGVTKTELSVKPAETGPGKPEETGPGKPEETEPGKPATEVGKTGTEPAKEPVLKVEAKANKSNLNKTAEQTQAKQTKKEKISLNTSNEASKQNLQAKTSALKTKENSIKSNIINIRKGISTSTVKNGEILNKDWKKAKKRILSNKTIKSVYEGRKAQAKAQAERKPKKYVPKIITQKIAERKAIKEAKTEFKKSIGTNQIKKIGELDNAIKTNKSNVKKLATIETKKQSLEKKAKESLEKLKKKKTEQAEQSKNKANSATTKLLASKTKLSASETKLGIIEEQLKSKAITPKRREKLEKDKLKAEKDKLKAEKNILNATYKRDKHNITITKKMSKSNRNIKKINKALSSKENRGKTTEGETATKGSKKLQKQRAKAEIAKSVEDLKTKVAEIYKNNTKSMKNKAILRNKAREEATQTQIKAKLSSKAKRGKTTEGITATKGSQKLIKQKAQSKIRNAQLNYNQKVIEINKKNISSEEKKLKKQSALQYRKSKEIKHKIKSKKSRGKITKGVNSTSQSKKLYKQKELANVKKLEADYKAKVIEIDASSTKNSDTKAKEKLLARSEKQFKKSKLRVKSRSHRGKVPSKTQNKIFKKGVKARSIINQTETEISIKKAEQEAQKVEAIKKAEIEAAAKQKKNEKTKQNFEAAQKKIENAVKAENNKKKAEEGPGNITEAGPANAAKAPATPALQAQTATTATNAAAGKGPVKTTEAEEAVKTAPSKTKKEEEEDWEKEQYGQYATLKEQKPATPPKPVEATKASNAEKAEAEAQTQATESKKEPASNKKGNKLSLATKAKLAALGTAAVVAAPLIIAGKAVKGTLKATGKVIKGVGTVATLATAAVVAAPVIGAYKAIKAIKKRRTKKKEKTKLREERFKEQENQKKANYENEKNKRKSKLTQI